MTRHSGNKTRRSDCPISFGLDLFGDRWTLLILRDIMFYQRRRFSDFAPQERIATNILADRLSRLEAEGLIDKQRDEELRNQFIYSVTDKGHALLPTLVEMTLWGLEFDRETPASQAFIERVRADRRSVAREITRAVQNGTFSEYRRTVMGISAGSSLTSGKASRNVPGQR